MNPMKIIDLGKIRVVHFVGIKGVAMTALAIVAKELGMQVTGSDITEEFPTNTTLHRQGISYTTGFSPQHISSDINLVIYTGAHQGIQNIEVQVALKRGIKVLPQGKALGLFMQGKRGLSVAGSHGKTTTSAWIAYVLSKLNLDPTFAIGCGEILSLGTSGHWGKGDFFVAEADEYVTDPTHDPTPRFMWQHPEMLVVTNIDFDHPDVYQSLEEVKKAFIGFANSLPENGVIVANADDTPTASIIPFIKRRIITYGEEKNADFRVEQIKQVELQSQFTIFHKGVKLATYKTDLPGKHNIRNATAVIATLVTLGIDPRQLIKPLASFCGTKRRFEFITEKNGKLFFDDYAHHPTEITATITGARQWYPKKRIIVVFQPHTYSRTQALLQQFAHSLAQADITVIADIYTSAREKPIAGLTGKTLFYEAQKIKKDVQYAPTKADVLQYLETEVRTGDLIITMGAGDIFTWIDSIKCVL